MKKSKGFGFIPEESTHHFLIFNNDDLIEIYERFEWDEKEIQVTDINNHNKKAVIEKEKFRALRYHIEKEFNSTLNKNKLEKCIFSSGNKSQVPLNRLLGKELVLLFWAIEDCDIKDIDKAISSWVNLSPEERWYLFTMANQKNMNYEYKNGWRKALKYIFIDN